MKTLPDARAHVAPVLTLLAIPLLLTVAFGRDWLYTPIGNLDPWYNVGYFLHYSDPTFLAGHYKESRLAWIMPGFLLYELFKPEVANFVLHAGALVTATVFVYLTLARLVGREIGLLVASLLTFYFPFLGSGGWDYQTTPSGAYYALTLYCLTCAAQSFSPRRWLIVAGVSFAATFHSDIIFMNMVPVLAAHYLVAARVYSNRGRSDLLSAGLWVSLGFAALTIALCLFAWSMGRSFLFFWPIVEIVMHYVGDPTNMRAWWLPWNSFWFASPRILAYLAIPASTLLISVLYVGSFVVRRSARKTVDPIRLVLIGQFVFVGSLWIFWQSIGHVALEPDYFAYPIIIPAFIAIGGLAAAQKDGSVAPAVASAAVIFLTSVGLAFWWHRGMSDSSRILLLVGSAASVTLACLYSAAWFRGALVAASMGVFIFVHLVLRGPYDPWRLAVVEPQLNCMQAEHSFDEIVALNKLVRRFQPVWWKTWFWIGPYETTVSPAGCTGARLLDFRGSLISTGLSSLGAASDRTAADIVDDSINLVSLDGVIGAVVADSSLLDGLVERFQKAGKMLELVHKEPLQVGALPATLALYRVNPSNKL